MDVRPATHADLEQLNDLYNFYVLNTHVTFDLEPATIAWRAEWFSHYGTSGPHRVIVAAEDDELLGFASSSRWRPKAAYETSVEASIYCRNDATGRGIGKLLYEHLFTELGNEDVHRAYAGIALPNDASIALHESFGFKQVAYFSEQGRKFGKYWDVAWFEKRFD